MTTIQDMTEQQALAEIRKTIDAAFKRLESKGVPYPATIADAMETAAKAVITEKYAEAACRTN